MTATIARSPGLRIAQLGAALGIGAPLVALAAAIGSGQGLWHFAVGLTALRWMLYLAAAGLLISVVALIWGLVRRGSVPLWLPVLAMAIAAIYVWQVLGVRQLAEQNPPIHDVTTDLASVPQFTALAVRPDNFDTVPDRDRADLKPLSNEQRWAVYHREAYADIAPLILGAPPARVYDAAVELVGDRGWQIALADRAQGRIEATDTVSLFRFKDDVVILITPAPGGARVDMRSVSRVGVSDLGYNAARVRAFLADLRRRVGG